MAERWQQWMPLHIDRWKGSAHVQAMHPCARVGYLYLLTCAWQSEDCSVPSDPDELADLSGLGVVLWNEHAPRILRRFTREADRLVNEVLRDEWREAKRIFESRSHAAKKTNSGRSLDGDRTPTDQSPQRSADTITGTETPTGTKAKPLASTADAVPAERGKLIGRMPLPGKAGEYEIFEQDADGWQQTYPGVDVRQELRECKQWLVDNPNLRKTAKGMRRFINSWMAREQDKGGRNGISGGNQQANRVSGAVQRQSESDDGFRNIAQRRYGVPAANEANAGSVHKPNDHRGNGGDVPGAVGGDGDGVRDAGFHGRTIEGHPG